MDITDIEIEENEEIIGDLGRNADQRETEEARALSVQEPTPCNPGNLMTHTERLTLRPVYKSVAVASTPHQQQQCKIDASVRFYSFKIKEKKTSTPQY